MGVRVWKDNKKFTYYKGNQLQFWANGNPISNGYRFKEPGKKSIVVKKNGKSTQYTIQVNTDLQGKVRNCTVVSRPQKSTYRQSIDPFDTDSILMRCTYVNGDVRDFSANELEVTVNGTRVKDNYKFKVPGEKKLLIKLEKYKYSYPLTVVPTFTKEVSRYQMTSEPKTLQYEVGGMFHACELAVTCYYTDGTSQTFSGDQLDITANTVQVYEGYNFLQAGKKKIVVSLGNFKKKYSVAVGDAGRSFSN